MIQTAINYPEGEEKILYLELIANQMKKDYLNWNKDGVEDQKIFDDLYELSGGKIKISATDFHLLEQRVLMPRRRQANNNQQKKKY